MRATILDGRVSVFSDMDFNSPIQAELGAGSEAELGKTKNKRGVDWGEVILPDGRRGYILGDTNIFPAREVVLRQRSVCVYKNPSEDSTILYQYMEGMVFNLVNTVRGEDGFWMKVRDAAGREGYISGGVQIEETNPAPAMAAPGAEAMAPAGAQPGEADPGTVEAMHSDLNGWGVGLILLGIISIALAGFLDPIWGGMLMVVGVITLIVKHRAMFIVIGVALLWAGLMNMIAGGGWLVFGLLQLYWGVQELRKFGKYG